MADIDIVQPHGKTVAEVRQIVDGLTGKLADKFDLKCAWDGDTMNIERSGLTGSLAIDPTNIHIVVKLGLLLKALKGTIESELVGALKSRLG